MGQRANMVILRHSEWELFYDHWCANRLDVELFWGPELATTFIEQRNSLRNRNDWLDEVWCEGGAIIDQDARILTWFGGEDIQYDIPLRRVFLDLMKTQWPGWQLRWAEGGIVELGHYLGLPREMFLTKREPDPEEGFKILTEYPEANGTLLTVRQRGRTLAARVYGHEEALELGASQLPRLLGIPLVSALTWKGEMPTGGLHCDIDAHSLYYWRANPVAAIEERVGHAWNGWRTEWLRDQFEQHLALASADIRLPRRSGLELKRDILKHLRRRLTHKAANPARMLGTRVGATELNPWTEEARGSTGDEAKKLQVLDALEKELST